MSLSMKVRLIGVPVSALEDQAVEGVERGIDVMFDWGLAGVDSALEHRLHDRLERLDRWSGASVQDWQLIRRDCATGLSNRRPVRGRGRWLNGSGASQIKLRGEPFAPGGAVTPSSTPH